MIRRRRRPLSYMGRFRPRTGMPGWVAGWTGRQGTTMPAGTNGPWAAGPRSFFALSIRERMDGGLSGVV